MDHTRSDGAALARTAEELQDANTHAETLETVVVTALRSVPGACHVSLCVADPEGRLETAACTDPRGLDLDELQTKLGEGPSVHVVQHETVAFVPDLARDERWPEYAREAAARGLIGQLAVPLRTEAGPAVLTVYAERPGALTEVSLHTADLVASQASLALGKARQHDQLHDALTTRQDIGAAIGLVMSEHRLSRSQAFAHLARISQDSNTKLLDVADAVISEHETAVGRAHEGAAGGAPSAYPDATQADDVRSG